MQTFEDLEVWKRGCDLAVFVYESLRSSRDFGLKDQMQRAAVSIPSDVAEGYERSNREFVRFLGIAKGSAAELSTQALIADRVGAINRDQSQHIREETASLRRMLQSLASFRASQ